MTEIYLCRACSCHEVEGGHAPASRTIRGIWRLLPPSSALPTADGLPPASAPPLLKCIPLLSSDTDRLRMVVQPRFVYSGAVFDLVADNELLSTQACPVTL